MANLIINKGAGAIAQQSSVFDNEPEDWDDLTANVSIGFPILGIKGGKWHYRYKGEEAIIMGPPDANGRQFPVPAVQVVLLKAQQELSRTFYAGGYVEGVNNPPDCWSSDGVRPDETVVQPINPVCATCPNAAWGSGATPAAPKAQACQQRRRTVLVPCMQPGADLTNEMGGGPVLLSVPPGSLTNQVTYGDKLKGNRIRYYGVVTELSFTQDPNIAFPKIEFNFIRYLDDEEGRTILDMRKHEQVDRILMSKMVADETSAPEQAAQATGIPPKPAAQTTPRTGIPPRAQATPRPSMVKPPEQPAHEQPAPEQPAPIAQVTQAAAPPVVNRVGGFGVAMPPKAPMGQPAARPNGAGTGTIAGAMAKPATPPPSMRGVVKPLPPRQPEEPEADEHADAAAPEPEAVEGQLPDEMTSMFSDLMKAT